MTPSAADVEALLTRELADQKGYVAEVFELDPSESPEDWAIFESVRVVAGPDGVYQVRLVEGPGFMAAVRDTHEIAHELIRSVWGADPTLAAVPFELHVDLAEDFPDEWRAIIEEEARAFLAERNGFAALANGTDAVTDGVAEGAVVTLTGDRSLEISFTPGPGYERLGAGEAAAQLFSAVVERIKARLPQLEEWELQLSWFDDA